MDRRGALCLLIVGAALGLPLAAADCDPDPVRALPEFKSFAVRLEPDMLDKIVVACDPVSGVVDNLTQMVFGTEPGQTPATLLETAASGQKLLDFVRTSVTVAGGLEAHLIECTTATLWDGLLDTLPSPIRDAQKSAGEVAAAREKVEAQLALLEEKKRRNQPVTQNDHLKTLAAVRRLATTAQATLGPLGSLAAAAKAVIDDPASLLRSDEEAVAAAGEVARQGIENLERSCATSQAAADLQAFVALGQSHATATRLAEARSRKLERRFADIIDRNLGRLANWQRDPAVAELLLASGQIEAGAYQSWSQHLKDRQQAERKRAVLEKTLAEGGALCGRLRVKVALVEQRRAPFQRLVAEGREAIASCRLDAAQEVITRLSNLESSACGAFLTEGLLSDPPAPRGGLLGPTGPGRDAATFETPHGQIPPSAALRFARDEARAGCGSTTLKPHTPTPTPPPVQGPHPPGPQDVALVRGQPTVPPADSVWTTVADGTIKYVLYSGDALVTADYSWNGPGDIGPQGVAVTLTVSCKSAKVNRLATGIGITVENLDLYVAGKPDPVSHAEAPANCDPGQSQSASITVRVMPRARYADGARAEVRVGPFWAGSVKYPYTARKR